MKEHQIRLVLRLASSLQSLNLVKSCTSFVVRRRARSSRSRGSGVAHSWKDQVARRPSYPLCRGRGAPDSWAHDHLFLVDPKIDKEKMVHAPTVYDAAHHAGLTTAKWTGWRSTTRQPSPGLS